MDKKMEISKLKTNIDNPRVIKNAKFDKLVNSIKEFPEMLELRPIVVDEDMTILGGNMRHKAAIEAGLKEVPIKIAKGLTDKQKKEFIVKDNVNFGDWDWDVLGNTWNTIELKDWGLDVWQNDDDYFKLDDDLQFEDIKPSVKDEDYGKFECIMLYEDKKKLVETLNIIREKDDVKLDQALMVLVNNYK